MAGRRALSAGAGSWRRWARGRGRRPGPTGLSRAADRPAITHGVQSGDVSVDSGMVWARADRPSRMQVEVATTDSFTIRSGVFVDALPESDFTAKALIEDLPAGQDIFYRIRFQDLSSPTILGEPLIGRFRTAPADRRSVSFVWSGDTAGQGWGIDQARGGMRTYATMLTNRPDFFIHSGDTIYADGPIAAEVKLPDGTLWRNITTEEKSKAAETLASSAATSNTTCSTGTCARSTPRSRRSRSGTTTRSSTTGGRTRPDRREAPRYAIARRTRRCSRRAPARAFHEYIPLRRTPREAGRVYRRIAYGPLLDVFMLDMRSYRGRNGENREAAYGPKSALSSGRSSWPGSSASLRLRARPGR